MIEPYYKDDYVQIFHGDCLKIMPELNMGFDLVLTSPPYNVGLKYIGYNDRMNDDEYFNKLKKWVQSIFKNSSNESYYYFVVGEKIIFLFKELCDSVGYEYIQKLTWCKPNLCGGGSKISQPWSYLTEDILFLKKGKRRPMIKDLLVDTKNYFIIPSTQTNYNGENKRFHPAQFPIKLPKQIIARTPSKNIIDPFMGSGSVLLASKQLNRKCIGIEIEEKYCEIAAKRCAQQVLELA